MSILSVVETSGRGVSLSREADLRVERRFIVESDRRDEDEMSVRLAAGIPRMWAQHPTETYAHVSNIDATQRDDPWFWDVTVTYQNLPLDDQEEENPLDRAPVVSYGAAKFQRIAYKTIDGVPIVNSAREWFDPPLMIDDSRPVIRVQRNLDSFDINLAMQYQDAINADSFLGLPRYYVKVDSLNAQQERAKVTVGGVEQVITYWNVAAEFHVNYDSWIAQPLDAGYCTITATTASGQPVSRERIYSPVNGANLCQPVPLDGEGQQLADGADPVYLQFRVYREMPFSVLGLL